MANSIWLNSMNRRGDHKNNDNCLLDLDSPVHTLILFFHYTLHIYNIHFIDYNCLLFTFIVPAGLYVSRGLMSSFAPPTASDSRKGQNYSRCSVTIGEPDRELGSRKIQSGKVTVTGELVTHSQKSLKREKACSTLSRNTFITRKVGWDQALSAVTHC